jgi:hypothetical protein
MKKSPPTVEAYIGTFPAPIQTITGRLRRIIRRLVPDHAEAVYPGWKLIGYRATQGKLNAYFGFLALFDDKVVLGFEYGTMLSDPEKKLEGKGTQVRQLTFRRSSEVKETVIAPFVLEAAAIALERKRK